METEPGEALLAYARRKLAQKRVDFVVANEASESLGLEDNRATLVTADGTEPLATMPKRELADVILERLRTRLVL